MASALVAIGNKVEVTIYVGYSSREFWETEYAVVALFEEGPDASLHAKGRELEDGGMTIDVGTLGPMKCGELQECD